MSHGVQALRRSAVELEPRPDFRARLRQRIAAGAEPAEPITPGAAGLAALLMLAAALALLIHERSASAVEPGPMPMTAAAPSRPSAPTPMVVVNPSAPFVTFTDLSVPAFNGAVTSHVTSETPIDALANLPR